MSKQTNRNTSKSLKITAFTLAVALLFPFTSEALHLLGHSDHVHCTETSTTHFHQQEFDCEIYDFHLTPVLHVFDTQEKPIFTSNFKTIFPPVEAFHANTSFFQIKPRGPPNN